MNKIFVFLFCAVAAASCSGNESFTKATDAQEAAREFIRASLDGNYDKASFYLFKDSAGVNEMLLTKWKNDYSNWSQADKAGHKDASIVIITSQPVNDSAVNFIFTNSYKKKDTTTIKIVRTKGEWLVDLEEFLKTHSSKLPN